MLHITGTLQGIHSSGKFGIIREYANGQLMVGIMTWVTEFRFQNENITQRSRVNLRELEKYAQDTRFRP